MQILSIEFNCDVAQSACAIVNDLVKENYDAHVNGSVVRVIVYRHQSLAKMFEIVSDYATLN